MLSLSPGGDKWCIAAAVSRSEVFDRVSIMSSLIASHRNKIRANGLTIRRNPACKPSGEHDGFAC